MAEMTEKERDLFSAGYWECRQVLMFDIEKIILADSGHKEKLMKLLLNLKADEAMDHWDQIQREQPGITRAEYESQLEESCRCISQELGAQKSSRKPTLIRSEAPASKDKEETP